MKNENKNSGRKKKQIDTTFAKRLTLLLDEIKEKKGIVQKDVAQVVGVSRQALGKWASGETMPDVLDLVKLSNYFNVSADYLVGLSHVPSLDADIQVVCKYTGLSEKAIKNICLTTSEVLYDEDLEEYYDNENFADKRFVINAFLESIDEIPFFELCSDLRVESKKDFELNPSIVLSLKDKHGEKAEEVAKNMLDEKQRIYDKCDIIRYNLIRLVEHFSDCFDNRDNWNNFFGDNKSAVKRTETFIKYK